MSQPPTHHSAMPGTPPFRPTPREIPNILQLLPDKRYICDECTHEIAPDAVRYHCSRCADYDTCHRCQPSSAHSHADGEAQPLWTAVAVPPEPHTPPLTDAASFAALIDDALHRFADRPCLGQRYAAGEVGESVRWLSYAAVRRRVHACSLGLGLRVAAVRRAASRYVPALSLHCSCECGGEARPAVAIWAANSADWLVADLAAHLQHYVVVPVDHHTADADAADIMRQAGAAVICVDTATLQRLVAVAASLPALHTVVVLDAADLLMHTDVPGRPDVAVVTIEEVERAGAAVPVAARFAGLCEARKECVVSLMYTSGSTGGAGSAAKGVLVTDASFGYRVGQPRRGHDVRMSCYLPLSNSTGRSQAVRCLSVGGALGITRSPGQLLDDLAWVQPTTLSCPPRMWSTLHATYNADMQHALQHTPRRGRTAEQVHAEVEQLVAGRLRARLGGRVVSVSTGGALSSHEQLAWLARVFGASNAANSYGATECGSIARNGVLLPGVVAQLLPVPALGFAPSDTPWPRGELCVHTPNMAAGYTSAHSTSAAFIQLAGRTFYRTGDAVELRRGERGQPDTIRILDRVSSVVKLSNGLFVSPEAIELAIELHCHQLLHILVHAPVGGDGLLAVLVPRADAAQWTEAQWLERLEAVVTERKFPAYSRPVRVYVDRSGESWEALGLIAVQQKKRRSALLARYRTQLDRLASQTFAVDVCADMEAVTLPQFQSELQSLRHRLQTALMSHLPTATQRFDAYAGKSWQDAGGDSMAAIAAAHSTSLILPNATLTAAQILGARCLDDLVLDVLEGKNGDDAAIDWEVECKLPLDLRERCVIVQPASALPGSGACRVLLTGATGFLGCFILAELLDNQPACSVVCIVRAASQSEAVARLARSMVQYGLAASDKAALDKLSSRRVCVEVGDLAAERFDLPSDRYHELVHSVTHVIHNASRVNFVLPYAALRRDNVLSTLHILRFCIAPTASHRPTMRLTHISTASTTHLTPRNIHQPQHGGYAQSKYVAERLVMAAAEQLAVPACIVRPTSIIGDSRRGYGPVDASRDFVSAVWLGLAQVGRVHLHGELPGGVAAGRPLSLLNVLPQLTEQCTPGGTSDAGDERFRLVGVPPAFQLVPVDHVAFVVVQLTTSTQSSAVINASASVVQVSNARGSTSSIELLLAADLPFDMPVVVGREAEGAWRQLVEKDMLPPVMRAFREQLLQGSERWRAPSRPDPRSEADENGYPAIDLALLRRCFQRLK